MSQPTAKTVAATLTHLVQAALDDLKALDTIVLDVRNMTSITDVMIVASGTSTRHVQSLAQRVVEFVERENFEVLGIEGEDDGEWILVDLGEVVVHVMHPQTRAYYNLEGLWQVGSRAAEAQPA